MNKQQRDMIILGVVLFGLIGAVIFTMKPSAPKHASTRSRVTDSSMKKKKHGKDKDVERTAITWVKNDRLAVVVAEVAGRRDPFHDLQAPIKVAGTPPRVDPGKPLIPTNLDPNFNPGLPVAPVPIPEKPPEVSVKGIVLNRTVGNYALVTIGDRAMTVYEDSPAVNGWTVSKITAREVWLTKGKQTLPYRLGGS